MSLYGVYCVTNSINMAHISFWSSLLLCSRLQQIIEYLTPRKYAHNKLHKKCEKDLVK